MQFVQVADGIHRMTRGVCNFYLVEDAGKLLLVDAGTLGDWKFLLDTLRGFGKTLDDLDAIVVTHAHSDHTGFAERARTKAPARVWIHTADAAAAGGAKQPRNEKSVVRYYLSQRETYRTTFSLGRRRGFTIVPIVELSTFEDGERLEVPGQPCVVHLPGHTEGSCAVLFEDRDTVLTGDALVTRNILTGRVGPQVMPAALNHNTAQALASLELLPDRVQIILPGHGDPWNEGVPEAVRQAKLVASQ